MNKTDLEDRLVNFSVLIIEIVNGLPNSKAGNHLGGQIVRSGSAPALNLSLIHISEPTRPY